MFRRKLKQIESQEKKWPLTADELIEQLDKRPLPELFNAVYFTVHDFGSKIQYGYASTSSFNKARKIWALASDWQSLITRESTPKQNMLGLTLHRLTGSKEVIDILHKCNHTVSYNDVRMQNLSWSRMLMTKQSILSNLRKGVVTHTTIDNNDGRQDTLTGSQTTHDTNKTLFQLPSPLEERTIPVIGISEGKPLDLAEFEQYESIKAPPYNLGKRVGPPLFPEHKDNSTRSKLDECLQRDIAWSAAGEEIDLAVVYDMLHADAKRNEKYLQFSSERLVNGTKGFFDPIKKLKLKTGIEKRKKTPRAMSLLKEDRQAFGLIIAKAISLEEAFEYPITSVPLSLATPDATLRQSDKASLRNFLINDSGSFTGQLPKNEHWLDGMAAVRSLKPRKTYAEWVKSFINFTTPAKAADARSLGIINDTYRENGIKSVVVRGEGFNSKAMSSICFMEKSGKSFFVVERTKLHLSV